MAGHGRVLTRLCVTQSSACRADRPCRSCLQSFEASENMALTALTVDLLLAWADMHYEQTGKWPRVASGRVRGCRGRNLASY